MTEAMKLAYLKDLSMFKDIREGALKRIVNIVKIKTLSAGEIINYGNERFTRIYFVVSGKIKLAELSHIEGELVKDILTGGEVFGDLELGSDPGNYEFAEALTGNTIICFFNTSDFTAILQSYSQIAFSYVKMVDLKLRRLEDRLSDLMLRDVKSRFVRFIKSWASSEGSKVDDKIILENHLTHSDIANIISTSRQTVTVLFREMKDSGLLDYNRRLIQLNGVENWNCP